MSTKTKWRLSKKLPGIPSRFQRFTSVARLFWGLIIEKSVLSNGCRSLTVILRQMSEHEVSMHFAGKDVLAKLRTNLKLNKELFTASDN